MTIARWKGAAAALGAIFVLVLQCGGQTAAAKPAVPTVDADAGSCSVTFKVNDARGKRIYNAGIKVHLEHGFLGSHQDDLQVSTNTKGEARFEGLPDSTDGALFFRAGKGDMRGYGFYSPDHECHAQHFITLTKGSPADPMLSESGEK